MHRIRRTRRCRRSTNRFGTTAVEFALTAPILLLLLFASLELSRMNMMRETANNAAYEAARKCCVPGATASDGEAVGLALLAAVGVQGATVDVQPDTIVWDTLQVTATVTIPYNNNVWVTPLLSKGYSTTAICQLNRERSVSMAAN